VIPAPTTTTSDSGTSTTVPDGVVEATRLVCHNEVMTR
jgi:hypothetical protein